MTFTLGHHFFQTNQENKIFLHRFKIYNYVLCMDKILILYGIFQIITMFILSDEMDEFNHFFLKQSLQK